MRTQDPQSLADEAQVWKDAFSEALSLLERVSAAAPARRGSHVHNAGIPWSLITEIRELVNDGSTN